MPSLRLFKPPALMLCGAQIFVPPSRALSTQKNPASPTAIQRVLPAGPQLTTTSASNIPMLGNITLLKARKSYQQLGLLLRARLHRPVSLPQRVPSASTSSSLDPT